MGERRRRYYFVIGDERISLKDFSKMINIPPYVITYRLKKLTPPNSTHVVHVNQALLDTFRSQNEPDPYIEYRFRKGDNLDESGLRLLAIAILFSAIHDFNSNHKKNKHSAEQFFRDKTALSFSCICELLDISNIDPEAFMRTISGKTFKKHYLETNGHGRTCNPRYRS